MGLSGCDNNRCCWNRVRPRMAAKFSTWSVVLLVLCATSGLGSAQQQQQQQQQQQPPPLSNTPRGSSSESISDSASSINSNTNSYSDSNNNYNNNNNGDSEPLVSPPLEQPPHQQYQQYHHHPPSSVPAGSSLSSPSVRAVSTRPSSDISTTSGGSGGDGEVPTHYGNCRRYDVCPTGDTWCSFLDENEKLALEAIHALHHQLDDDKNGNIDLYESNEFLREELKYDRDYEKRQENFHRNNDNQVSVKELWETWVKSEVHNWTVDQTVEWIGTFVGLPQYTDKFTQLEVNGTYLPRLAVNHHNFLSANLGIKDVITRQKLTLKAQDVVLFGPPRNNSNHTKDAILTTLLVVAVTVCYLVYCRYKSSQRDLTRMADDMAALMKAEQELRDLQNKMEQVKCDQEVRDKEAVTHRASSDDEDELMKLREEVIVLRNELQRAEVELQDKCWVPPPALTHWLQLTYELESKAHSKKRQSAEKQLKQAKDACDKLKKKRSSLMGAFVATHARSIDDVDKAILEARAALTEVTQELQERMHRWKQIEILVKSPIVNNPGLASLEILLRTSSRGNPYLGTASVLSNSQDDIDDDGASSIYCPSAVHKLISTSAYMMFPGQNLPGGRSSQHATSATTTGSSDYSSPTNYGSGGGGSGGDSGGRPSQSPDVSRRDHQLQQLNQHQQRLQQLCQTERECSFHSCVDCAASGDGSEVSGPIANIHAPIARSKSVQSMLSLRDPRDQRAFTRESSSKDSSNGEEDAIMGDAAEMMMSAKDRRVTFRNAAAAERRVGGQLRSFQGRLPSAAASAALYEPLEFEESRTFYARKPLVPSGSGRLEGAPVKSSEEDLVHGPPHQHQHRKRQQHQQQLQEEPDLIPYPLQRTNNNDIIEEETISLCDDHLDYSESSNQHRNSLPYHHHNHNHFQSNGNATHAVYEDNDHPHHHHHHHNAVPKPVNMVAPKKLTNSKQSNEPTEERSANNNTISSEESLALSQVTSQGGKGSFFGKISKLWRNPRHAPNNQAESGTVEKSLKKKTSSEANGFTTSALEQHSHQNSQNNYNNYQIPQEEHNNHSDKLLRANDTHSKLVALQKNLVAPNNNGNCYGGEATPGIPASSNEKGDKKVKAHKVSLKFLTSLRSSSRKDKDKDNNSTAHKNSDMSTLPP